MSDDPTGSAQSRPTLGSSPLAETPLAGSPPRLGQPDPGPSPPTAQLPGGDVPWSPPLPPPDLSAGGLADPVRRQLAALGSPRYDLLVLDAATGVRRAFRGTRTPDQVLAALPWLAQENARAGEVLLRPLAPLGYSVLSGVSRDALERGRGGGFEPAAVVQLPDGSREIWLRAGADLGQDVQQLVDRGLGQRFHPRLSPAVPGYGHLAGFDSPAAARAGPAAGSSVTLDEAAGGDYRAGPALAARAARWLATLDERARLDRALAQDAALVPARVLARGGPGELARVSPEHTRALLVLDAEAMRRGLAAMPPAAEELPGEIRRVELARQAFGEAWRAAGDLPPGAAARDQLEGRIVATYRALRDVEDSLAARLGVRDLPETLAAGGLEELARRHEATLAAEARQEAALPGSRGFGPQGALAASLPAEPPALPSPEPSLGANLPDADQLFRPPEPRIGLEAAVSRHTAADLRFLALETLAAGTGPLPDGARRPAAEDVAAAWRHRLSHELTLEAREATLERDRRHLARLHEQGSLGLAAFEPRAVRDPSPANTAAYDARLDRLAALENRHAELGGDLLQLARLRVRRDLDRSARELDRHPAAETLSSHLRLLDLRREIDGRPWPRRQRTPDTAELAAAKERFGESAARLLREPGRPARLALEDEFVKLRAAQDRHAAAAAVRELRAARHELRRAGDLLLAAGRQGGAPSPVRLDRFAAALAREQRAEAAWGERLDRRDPAIYPLAGQLAPLLGRLSRGDLRPQTLARLHRAVVHHLPDNGLAWPPLRDNRPATGSLSDALTAWRQDRAALVRARHHLKPSLQGSLAENRALASDLTRFRDALDRYQTSLVRLERETAWHTRPRQGALVPAERFLAHPVFTGAPHRALAAWTAHALRQGVPPDRIPHLLARSLPARTAAPRLLSPGSGAFVAVALRHLARLVQGAEKALVR
ncbi:MAG TPA: DNA-primase RepB domain-containing protein [Thermoanaerobaculia bacterium]|nr:DNA-primase RepB domain-containing protein [Thermoanaerobaculia bacterium]